ncbi:calmodulin-binding receptor-like cytoplasmic kinase 2 [Zingiber officinale]|uniref:calmodulin-binding receptor-like cytoplasmic kinase 2 n=1 Tax=Zingiber officinale TaxID=94328 RepID=UPI001C4C7CEE|nr:calmodulin-binding receptor-like cytoplasmic kinase 2 [Zingiber officinale]
MMRSPAKSLGSQSPIDGRRKSWGDSCDVASGSSGSSVTTSSSSSRNPLSIAARAISSCFVTPKDRSPPSSDNFSEDNKTPSHPSATTQESFPASSQGGMRQGMGIHGGGRSEPSVMRFTMSDITKATKNFSPSLKIGQGGSGTVYKAKLGDGTVVAIKRLKKNGYQSHLRTEFHNEIQTLAQIEHQNLVRLHGFLEDQDERIIVVEYVTNGTLREHLDCQRGKVLELSSRLDVAIDVAHAITYLHMYSDNPIIHRDIKSSNILLTNNLRAKVADFGFARLFATESDATHISTQVKGTAGYLDPEYLRTYQLTVKSDVYSFGVLLIELVSGRRPIEAKKELMERVTIKWAIKKFTEGNSIQILDPNLQSGMATNFALEKILELALLCLAPTKRSRPIMQECAKILWTIRKEYWELSDSHFNPV